MSGMFRSMSQEKRSVLTHDQTLQDFAGPRHHV